MSLSMPRRSMESDTRKFKRLIGVGSPLSGRAVTGSRGGRIEPATRHPSRECRNRPRFFEPHPAIPYRSVRTRLSLPSSSRQSRIVCDSGCRERGQDRRHEPYRRFFLWTRCLATPRASAICGTVRGPPSCRLLNSPQMSSDQMES